MNRVKQELNRLGIVKISEETDLDLFLDNPVTSIIVEVNTNLPDKEVSTQFIQKAVEEIKGIKLDLLEVTFNKERLLQVTFVMRGQNEE